MNLDWDIIEKSWDQTEKSVNTSFIYTGKKLSDQYIVEEENNLVYNQKLGVYGFSKKVQEEEQP
jgi:hypothetical protein